MNEIINSTNNPKKVRPKQHNLDFLDTKPDNNLTNNCNEDLNKIKKIMDKKITSPKNYRENNAKTEMDIKKNLKINEIYNSYKTQNMSSTDNIYKEIRRPLNYRNNTNTLTLNTFSSNANSNYKSFAEKIQNLDIMEHTENSFISPETEVEAIITNANCEAVKPEVNTKTEENKGNETKENNLDLNKNNTLVLNESNNKNSADEKSKKINYRFESPLEQNNNNNMDIKNNKSNLVLPSIISPSKKINYSKNSETLKTNKDRWDNKSHSHYMNKPTDKINNSMISNLSHKSNLEQSLKISISNGIIDINQYEMAMSSTKNNEAKPQVTSILKSDSKENNPTIDFISSIINNRNLINKENRELNYRKDSNNNNILVDYNNENYEKLVNIENDKARNNTEGYKSNNMLVLSEKHLGRSSSNFESHSNECNYEEFSSHYCNDISTDKQYTLEKQFNENQQLYINSVENQGDLSNLKEDRKIKRNKSTVQSFVQLNKSDVGKLIQNKIQKESANKKKDAAQNNSFSIDFSGNLPERHNSSNLKNEMLQPKKCSKSNTKLVNLNQISEITEETTVPNNIYNIDSILDRNSNNSIKLIRSPKSRRKRSDNNKVLISKNSLYMEKVLFFVDNLQKTNNIPQKFEDEFLVLKSEKNGTHEYEYEYEKKYVVPPNYLNLKSNEIIEKNKSFKKLEKTNGKVKLFEIFSNETLDNYNKDRLMANDLDLKEKYFKNAKYNNSLNIYSKQHYLNTSLNNKMSLNNSHQINKFDYNVENGNSGGYKSYENSVINPNQQLRSFLPQPRIILRDDILKFDRERQDAEESTTTNDSFNKTNLKSFKDKNGTKSNSFLNLSSGNNNNQTKSLENPNDKLRVSRVKNSPLIMSAENVLNLKNQNYSSYNNINNILNENDLQEYENQVIVNQSSFLNKSNYSQDLKNFQNEYWQKRRSEPYKYNNNNINNFNYGNSGNENSYFFNESLNKNLNPNSIHVLKSKENAYRSSELQLKRAIIEKSNFEELKNLNDKNVEKIRHQKKIDFKNDVFVNRKRMDVIEGAINKMVVEATHKAKDNMDLFMYNSSKDELITIEK